MPQTSLQVLPGLQRLLDVLPLVRGMRPLPPTHPQGMPKESEESVSPLQIGGAVNLLIPTEEISPRRFGTDLVIPEDEGGAARGVGGTSDPQPNWRSSPEDFGGDRMGATWGTPTLEEGMATGYNLEGEE